MQLATAEFERVRASQSKEPRVAIKIFFSDDGAEYHWFTSHSDCLLPDGETNFIHGVIAAGSTSISQEIKPLDGNATIGTTNFKLRDPDAAVGTLIKAHRDSSRGIARKKVEFYIGDASLTNWDDYTRYQTNWIKSASSAGNFYTFKTQDIQRQAREDVFEVKTTNIIATVNPGDATINVLSTDGFEMVAHGTSFTDAPSATVGYVRIADTVIRYTGKTSNTFTGCTHAVLNTRAATHEWALDTDADKQPLVEEFIYIELPALKLAYAILTGILYGQAGATLPDHWHVGIPAEYVHTPSFTDIGDDLWDTTSDQAGLVFRFAALKKTDGKKFIEKEINLPVGVFMPILADGSISLKRMTGVLSSSEYVKELDHGNLTAINSLTFDHTQIANIYDVSWNYDFLSGKFTRINELVDLNSITINKKGTRKELKFRGLHGSRHTSSMIGQRFDSLRDRYAGEPLLITVTGNLTTSGLEVGEVVRLNTDMVRDYTDQVTHLDRAFEVQRVSVDWTSGKVSLKLFGSSLKSDSIIWGSDSYALTDAHYSTIGVELSTVLTINVVGDVGHIQLNGHLPGGATLAAGTYYYLGDLELDSGYTVTLGNNVHLKVMGHLQINGVFDGVGRGHPGAIGDKEQINGVLGTIGYMGVPQSVGGVQTYFAPTESTFFVWCHESYLPADGRGFTSSIPALNLIVSGDLLAGLPQSLIGTSGGAGGAAQSLMKDINGNVSCLSRMPGSNGGASGAGLVITARGASFGVSGKIDLSGVNGQDASTDRLTICSYQESFGGMGAGGAPGACLFVIDGITSVAPSEHKVITDSGALGLSASLPYTYPYKPNCDEGYRHSYYTGMEASSGSAYVRTFRPIEEQSPVQDPIVLPPNEVLALTVAAVEELTAETTTALAVNTNVLANTVTRRWSIEKTPNQNFWRDHCWADELGLFVAVASSGVGNRVMTSRDGLKWVEQTSAADLDWRSVCWAPGLGAGAGLFVAVASSGTGSRVMTSPDGEAWTLQTSAADNSWQSVCFADGVGAGLLVAVSSNSTGGSVMTSPDGAAWTLQTGGVDAWWQSVRFAAELNSGAGLLVAVGTGGLSDSVMTSPDGAAWTLQTSVGVDSSWVGLTWAPGFGTGVGLLVAVSYSGLPGEYVMTSPDAVNWTLRVSAADHFWSSVCHAPEIGLFIAVAESSNHGPGYRIMTSPDVINWTERAGGDVGGWGSVCWVARLGLLSAVGYEPDGVMTSAISNVFKLDDIPAASTTISGVVELATDTETQTGTDTARAITPANLKSLTATELRRGLIELATALEVATGTDASRAVTPAGLAPFLSGAALLAKILPVDGVGSGLDADLLDGQHATSFFRRNADDTASGSYHFSHPVFRRSNDVPSYQKEMSFGSVDVDWRKVADITFGTEIWTGVALKIVIEDTGTNHGGSLRGNGSTFVCFVQISRSTDVLDSNNRVTIQSDRSTDYVRVVKIDSGTYELQIKSSSLYRELHVSITTISIGSHSLTYATAPVESLTVGTIYTPTITAMGNAEKLDSRPASDYVLGTELTAAIDALVDASPGTLDTLNELAAALGDDPNFATTIATALAGKQPIDATLTALAALATVADKLIYATGIDTFATTTLSAFARTLLDDADAAAARATLGVATAGDLAAHVDDTTDAHNASAISSVATETIAATDQQAVTKELSQNLITKTVLFDFIVDADATLSAAQNLYGKIKITGAILTTSRNLVVATTQRMFFVENATAQTITIKTAAGAGVAVLAGDKIMLICDGVDVVNPQNPSLLFEYEVVGAAQTEIDVTGLDINAHKSYRVEIDAIAALDSIVYLFINNDTVLANYNSQYLHADGTSLSGGRGALPEALAMDAGGENLVSLLVSKNGNNETSVVSNETRNNSSAIKVTRRGIGYPIAVANITQLTITSATANALGIGTKIRIYRGDK